MSIWSVALIQKEDFGTDIRLYQSAQDAYASLAPYFPAGLDREAALAALVRGEESEDHDALTVFAGQLKLAGLVAVVTKHYRLETHSETVGHNVA